ncbi:MAG TPA: DUF6527 family protein [Pirellulales bacterium]|jgi:hypothetical protein|nr:DUF6527 family protein [Pirellulales bacterium]
MDVPAVSDHHEPGNMVRDERDEWPADEPVGSFDISTHGLQGRPSVNAHIEFICPNGKHCAVFLGPVFEARPNENEPNVWAWDHNIERPTITPSINCIAEKDGKPTGGCGWHGFITAGRIT